MMASSFRNIIMAGVLLIYEGTLLQLYSADKKDKPSGCSDYIIIHGESNINRFAFIYNHSINPEYDIRGPGRSQTMLEIAIPVRDFVATNPLMYNDFLSLLKSSEYPEIMISFPASVTEKREGNSVAEVKITIAGITRAYPVVWSVSGCNEGIFLRGSESMLLSDFRLQRPERLSGLIKVNDQISVSFGFIINFTTINHNQLKGEDKYQDQVWTKGNAGDSR